MADPVFYSEASVFFVGGNGDKSGRTSLAGGCTRDWWDGECSGGTDAEKLAAMGKLMVDGGPVVDEGECAFTSSNNRISKAGVFSGAEVGMVAYVVETPVAGVNLATMRYRVTDVDASGDWIEIGDATGSDATVTVKVGGAFDTLQNALDETDASLHGVDIYTNLSEVLASSVDVDSGGSVLKNTFKRIVGYRTVPGDMGIGGAYYESVMSVLQNGTINAGKCVSLDADGGSYPVVDMDGADNVVFENLHLHGSNGYDAVCFTSVAANVAFINCRFSDVQQVNNTAASHVLFEGCYSDDDIGNHHYICRGENNVLIGCVGKMATLTNLCNFVGTSGMIVGCVAVGGQFGVRISTSGAGAVVMGNTFYGTESKGIMCDGGDGVVAVDNIFCLATDAVGIYSRLGGSILLNDYNCFIETNGTALTAVGSEYGGGEAPVVGLHSVEVDCDFVDAVNFDFRVRNPAVLRGGRPGVDGTAGVIGAIGQAYQFAAKARMVNRGRIGIIR